METIKVNDQMIVIDWIDSDALICQHIRPLFVLVYDGLEDIELIMLPEKKVYDKYIWEIYAKYIYCMHFKAKEHILSSIQDFSNSICNMVPRYKKFLIAGMNCKTFLSLWIKVFFGEAYVSITFSLSR